MLGLDIGSMALDAAGGIAQVLSQGARHRHEKALNERTIEAQQNASQFEWDKNLEQWNRANEFNAPTQQMQRLKAAGLNPAMVYGSGGAKTVASQSPKYQAPRPTYNYAPPIDPTAVLGAFNDFRMKNAQVDLLRAQAETARSEANNSEDYYGFRQSHLGEMADKLLRERTLATGSDLYKDIEGNRHKMKDTPMYKQYSHQVREAGLRNDLTSKMIANQANRNTLLELDISNYYLNKLGPAAMKGLQMLITKGKSIAGVKGVSNKLRPNKALDWKKNKVFENFKTKQFDY